MNNRSGGWVEREVSQETNAFSLSINQICIHQSWQTIQGGLICNCGLTPHKHLLIRDSTALIQSPNIPRHA
tara:strand:- start:1290 stop:1502 length:213 start_codon:yes stop_codon:yes gene_type:complete